MQVHRYEQDKHGDMVEGWCKDHNMPCFPKDWLPTYSAIVDGVAFGSMYVTDSGIAYIENIVTSKESTHEERVEAVGLITENIARIAKDNCHCKWLIGASKFESILKGGEAHGFVITEQVHQMIRRL